MFTCAYYKNKENLTLKGSDLSIEFLNRCIPAKNFYTIMPVFTEPDFHSFNNNQVLKFL